MATTTSTTTRKRAATGTTTRRPRAKTTSAKTAKAPATKPAAASARREPSGASKALGIFSIGALTVAVGAALYETVRRVVGRGSAEHPAPDLMGDTRPAPGDRAPADFRPDPTASVPAGEREALRPAAAGLVPVRTAETQTRVFEPAG